MPHDAYDIGDPESRPYRYPWLARDAVTGEPLLARTAAEMTPRAAIINGRLYPAIMPVPIGERLNRSPNNGQVYRIEYTVPDAPRIDVTTMQEASE